MCCCCEQTVLLCSYIAEYRDVGWVLPTIPIDILAASRWAMPTLQKPLNGSKGNGTYLREISCFVAIVIASIPY